MHLDANAASTGEPAAEPLRTLRWGRSTAPADINLTGTLTNTNATLTLNATTGSWNFFGRSTAGQCAFADGSSFS